MTPHPRDWLRDETGRTGIDWPRVLLGVLSTAVLVGLVAAAATSTAAFGPYNAAWDGTTDLHDRVSADPTVESVFVRDTAQYESADPNETVAVVIAPEEAYASADAERVSQFVADGGTLVVLENFGTAGNALLADVGAETRVDGTLLRDEQEYYRGPTMPLATGIANHTYTAGIERLTLNHASALETAPDGDATVLVRTSEYAYRDVNGDGDLSDDETLDAYPVATVEPVGAGQVVVVGDPSIAINAMIDEPDNAAFLQRLYADADHVLIDLSHAEELPPLTAAVLAVRDWPLAQVALGTLGTVGIAALSRRRLRPVLAAAWARTGGRLSHSGAGRDKPGEAAPKPSAAPEAAAQRRAAVLRDRYPDWDDERIRRVIAALNRGDWERENR